MGLINASVDYFEQIWKQDAINAKKSKEMWDKRSENFNRHRSDERITKVLDLLLKKNMLQKNSLVLDVGCGPGKFVIEFAQKAKSVVGVDISPKMLQLAAENKASRKMENVKFQELDWEKADLKSLDWEKRFDLVTGIMSPGFSSREGLEKMISASKKHCFVCHFVERKESVLDVLRKDVLSLEGSNIPMNNALYCSVNYLWLQNLFPEVTYINTGRESILPLAEAASYYINRLEMGKPLTQMQKKKVLDRLNYQAVNETVRERVSAKIACIAWSVVKPENQQ